MVQFFRSGQNDDRRRRVLTDDTTTGVASAPSTAGKPSAPRRASARRYPGEALSEHQPRLIDVVPKKLTTLFGMLILGIALIAGIEAAYTARALQVAGERLPAFDLSAEGSLNNWFTSLTLDLSAVVAIVVYSLRRYRLDDYHGRYRIWLWAAACWLWLSVDEAASLHESLQIALVGLAGQSSLHATLAWLGTYALLIGGISLRLLFEMRVSRSSTAVLVLAGLTFGASVVAHLGWLPAAAATYQLPIEEGCEMAGSLLVLFSMCLHARYVVLEAQGLIAAKPEKAPAKEKAKEKAPRRGLFGRTTKIDPPHDSVRPAGKRNDLTTADSRYEDDDDDDAADDSGDDEDDAEEQQENHRLSKSERKALRRQQERQKRSRLG